jgi:hypothetical protein
MESVSTRLRGRWLIVAQAMWALVASLALSVFAAGVPVTLREASIVGPETRTLLANAGLSARFPAYFLLTTDILTMLGFSTIAALLAWRRRDDWMALFVALLLLLTGLLYTHPTTNAPVPVWIIAAVCGLAEICQAAFFYLFPNGRFTPRWTRWLLLPMVVWRPAIWDLVYLPNYWRLPESAETFGVIPQDSSDILLMVGLFVIGIGAQIYRYRRVSNVVQRQQVKWLMFGAAVTVGVVSTYVFVFNVFQLPQQVGQNWFLMAGGRMARQVALLAVPIAIAISILRYRLFEIDGLINRALVYGVLTTTLALVYFGSVVVLQLFFHRLTGEDSPLAVVASTLAIAALFHPLRQVVQNNIDRRFYRRKYDAERALQSFSATLRDEVDLQTLTARLTALVSETMEPVEVSLWLRDLPPTSRDAQGRA